MVQEGTDSRTRAASLVWMIGGLTLTLNEVFYNLWGMIVHHHAPEAEAWFPMLWIPWIGAGVVVSGRAWSASTVEPFSRRSWLTVLLVVGLYALLATIIVPMGLGLSSNRLAESALSVTVVGVGLLTLGAVGLVTTTPRERQTALICGAIFLLLAATVSVLSWPDQELARAWLSMQAPLAFMAAGLVGGWWIGRGEAA